MCLFPFHGPWWYYAILIPPTSTPQFSSSVGEINTTKYQDILHGTILSISNVVILSKLLIQIELFSATIICT